MTLAREPQLDWRHWESVACLADSIEAQHVVEVGTWRADTATYLLEHCPSIDRLTAVDPFKPFPGVDDRWDRINWRDESESQEAWDATAELARKRLSVYLDRGVLLRCDSAEAARAFDTASLDLVFIDGDHSLYHVLLDIGLWYPKVRRGGILSGHDYSDVEGTTRAVDAIPDLLGREVKYLPDAWFKQWPPTDWTKVVWYIEV
jgi:hypothetical protein